MTLALLHLISCQCIQRTQESTLARQLTSWEQPHHPSNLMSNVSNTLRNYFFYIFFSFIYCVCWYSNNITGFYLGSTRFLSQPGYRLLRLRFFVVFLCLSSQVMDSRLKQTATTSFKIFTKFIINDQAHIHLRLRNCH